MWTITDYVLTAAGLLACIPMAAIILWIIGRMDAAYTVVVPLWCKWWDVLEHKAWMRAYHLTAGIPAKRKHADGQYDNGAHKVWAWKVIHWLTIHVTPSDY